MHTRSTSTATSRTKLRWLVAPLAALAALVLAAPLLTACGGMSANRGSGGDDEGGFRGELTIENRSSYEICRIRIDQSGSARVVEDVQLAPGGTTTVTMSGDAQRMILTECGGERTVFGHPMNFFGSAIGEPQLPSTWTHDRLVLFDEGAVEAGPYDTEELSPRPISDWIFFARTDAELTSTLHEGLVAHARSGGWSEEFVQTWPINEWHIVRNELTGVVLRRTHDAVGFARWPEGHCTAQAFGFVQQHDGSDFTGPIRFNGTSTQLPIPCAAIDAMGGASSPAASDTSGGAGCSNTCSSAGDGECDDGGPGSQYAVCGLGTDCDDCGPR